MPTTRTVTVKSAGGDYSSLSSAEAGEQCNLVSLDRQINIECYAMGETTQVTIDGWTTDATHYISVYAPSTERHDGKWNTSKYRIIANAGFTNVIGIVEDFVRIAGLQLDNTNGSANATIGINNTASTTDVRIDDCLIKATGGTSNGRGIYITNGSSNTIRNSIIFKTQKAGIRVENLNFAPGVTVDNCTLAACGTYGAERISGTLAMRNTYSGGNTTDAYSGTMTLTTCAHDTATSFTGSTANVAHSTANFTNVSGGSEDYHLVNGSALIDAGTDLSATFTVDIDGDTRPQNSVFDIGADEYISVATGQPTWKRFGGIAYAATNLGVW